MPLSPIEIGSSSIAGTRYGELNQDYLAVQELFAGERPQTNIPPTYCLAICDGHGVLGDKAARFSGKAVVRHLLCWPQLRSKQLRSLPMEELETLMTAAFLKGHISGMDLYQSPPETTLYPKANGRGLAPYSLERTSTGSSGVCTYRTGQGPEKLLECGCTCTAAIVQGRTLCLANVGDSSAVLGSIVAADSSVNAVADGRRTYAHRVLTVQHNVYNPDEEKRLMDQHGALVKLLKAEGYLQVVEGPLAGYQLAVTRALCHKNMQAMGVIPEPHIMFHTLGPQDCCLVIHSDGVSDVMRPEEVVGFVMNAVVAGKSAAECAKELVEHAVQLGLSGPKHEADNTSAIVVIFR